MRSCGHLVLLSTLVIFPLLLLRAREPESDIATDRPKVSSLEILSHQSALVQYNEIAGDLYVEHVIFRSDQDEWELRAVSSEWLTQPLRFFRRNDSETWFSISRLRNSGTCVRLHPQIDLPLSSDGASHLSLFNLTSITKVAVWFSEVQDSFKRLCGPLVTVCVSGELRSFSDPGVSDSWMKNLYPLLDYESNGVMEFIIAAPGLDAVRSVPLPAVAMFDLQSQAQSIPCPGLKHESYKQQMQKMALSLALVESLEKLRHYKSDYVIRIRPDVALGRPLRALRNYTPDAFITPEAHVPIDDKFFFGNRVVANYSLGCCYQRTKIKSRLIKAPPELALHQCLQHGSIPIVRDPVLMAVAVGPLGARKVRYNVRGARCFIFNHLTYRHLRLGDKLRKNVAAELARGSVDLDRNLRTCVKLFPKWHALQYRHGCVLPDHQIIFGIQNGSVVGLPLNGSWYPSELYPSAEINGTILC